MGKLAEIKTKATAINPTDFINSLPDEQKRKDSLTILKMMQKAAGEKPKMWGSAIIGFIDKRYKSPNTDREVDWFSIGFSPRKANISIYLVGGLKKHEKDLEKLGKHKTGAGCLYINKLADIDQKILEKMFAAELK